MGFPAFGPRVDALNQVQQDASDNEAREARPSGFLRFRRLHIALFPVYLKLDGRRVVVVGAGPVARIQAGGAPGRGCRHPRRGAGGVRGYRAAGVAIEERRFEPRDLDGAWFVVAAAPPEVNRLRRRGGRTPSCLRERG